MPQLLPDSIRLRGRQKPQKISNLIRLVGADNYTLLYLADQAQPLLLTHTLKHMQLRLPTFIRVSKACLVNPAFIQRMQRVGARQGHMLLADGTQLLISRRRLPAVLAACAALALPADHPPAGSLLVNPPLADPPPTGLAAATPQPSPEPIVSSGSRPAQGRSFYDLIHGL